MSNIDDNLVGNGGFSVDYDYLVVALGAQVNTFNTTGVMKNCHFLKVHIFLFGIQHVVHKNVHSLIRIQ